MKRIIKIVLFLAVSVMAREYFVINAVINVDFTAPGDKINAGDSIVYVIEITDSGPLVINGPLLDHLNATVDPLIQTSKDFLRNSRYALDKKGAAYDLSYIEIRGPWQRIGQEITIKEQVFSGHYFTATGRTVFQTYDLPVTTTPAIKKIGFRKLHFNRDLLGRVK